MRTKLDAFAEGPASPVSSPAARRQRPAVHIQTAMADVPPKSPTPSPKCERRFQEGVAMPHEAGLVGHAKAQSEVGALSNILDKLSTDLKKEAYLLSADIARSSTDTSFRSADKSFNSECDSFAGQTFLKTVATDRSVESIESGRRALRRPEQLTKTDFLPETSKGDLLQTAEDLRTIAFDNLIPGEVKAALKDWKQQHSKRNVAHKTSPSLSACSSPLARRATSGSHEVNDLLSPRPAVRQRFEDDVTAALSPTRAQLFNLKKPVLTAAVMPSSPTLRLTPPTL